MTTLLVHSGMRGGDVRAGGHKHSCVPILAAAAIAPRAVTVDHAPDVEDSRVLAAILERAGARVAREGDAIHVDTTALADPRIPPELSRGIHGASYLLPAFLGRFGTVRCGRFGGCSIGDPANGGERPLHHVIDVLERFGASVATPPDGLQLTAARLSATDIDIAEYSERGDVLTGPLVSGATKTALLAAASADATSSIHHPYPKPDTWELVRFLGACGHEVHAEPEGVTVGPGHAPRAVVRHLLLSDLGEVLTYLVAGLVLRVPVRVHVRGADRVRRGLRAELAVLEAMGVKVRWSGSSVEARSPARLRAVDIEVTSVGIYSDHQPLFAVLLLGADGPSRIVERVWTNRFAYAGELAKLGARVTLEAGALRIEPSALDGADAQVVASDVRAAAALVLAALSAGGSTVIRGAEHLARGYRDLVGTLRALGARIEAVPD